MLEPMEQKSSLDIMRSLGGASGYEAPKVPGLFQTVSDSSRRMMEEHHQKWDEQKENIPASAREVADTVNLVGNSGREMSEAEIMEALYSRQDMGVSPENEIITTGSPDRLIDATHLILETAEDMTHVLEPESSWGLQHAEMTLARRKKILAYSNSDLQRLGWANIDDHGFGDPVNDRKGYFTELRSVSLGNGRSERTVRIPFYDTEENRERLWKTSANMHGMFLARTAIMAEVRFSARNIENSEGLATKYFHDQISNLGLWEFFGAAASSEAPTKTESGLEYHKGREFGEMTQLYHQLLTIEAMSARPTELRKLREENGHITPGWKKLFPESSDGEKGISEKEKEWVGNVYQMISKFKTITHQMDSAAGFKKTRKLEFIPEGQIEAEISSKVRGKITSHPDAVAETDPETQLLVRNRIKTFLGGGVNEEKIFDSPIHRENRTVASVDNLGWETFKVWDISSWLGWRFIEDTKDGYEDRLRQNRLKDTEFAGFYVNADFGGDVSLDTMKATMPWIFQLGYYAKSREAGPLGVALFSYDSFITDVTRTITFKGTDNVKRTLFESTWYGIPTKDHPEKTTWIHEMPWLQVGRRVLTKAYLPEFMAMREQTGVFKQATTTGLKLETFTDESTLFTLWKMISLMVTPQVVAEGILHDKDSEKLARDTDVRRLDTMNAIIAGLESYTQYDNVSNSKVGEGRTMSAPMILAQSINKAIDRFNARCGQLSGYPERKINKLKVASKLNAGLNVPKR